MKTEYIKIDPGDFSPEQLKRAGEIIRGGGLVAFPTENVFGLGADAKNVCAAEKIYAAKGRPSNNPLIVHVADPADAEEYVYTDERYYKIAKAFMPGPITVIMRSRGKVADKVSAGLDTLAIRCPSHSIAREFIKAADRPIAAPSANTSGRPSPTSADHVMHDLDGKVDMIIDGGECEVGLESTIVKLESDKIVLLRPGGVTYEMLTALLGDVEIARGVLERPLNNDKVESPGMLISHYAPRAPFFLVKGEDDRVHAYLKEKLLETGAFVLAHDNTFPESKNTISLGRECEAEDAAKRLFSALREADALGAVCIYAQYPDKSGIGLALLNRMLRASAFRIIEI